MSASRQCRGECRRGEQAGQRGGKRKADMTQNGHQCDRQADIGNNRRDRYAEHKPAPAGGVKGRLQYLDQNMRRHADGVSREGRGACGDGGL